MANNELYHYGVLGMKWGVRKSRGGGVSKTGRRGRTIKERPPAHEDYKKAHSKKSVREMSDAELRSRINRLDMERRYQELNPSAKNRGRKYVNSIIKTGTTIATATGTALTIYSNADKIRKLVK